MGRVQGRGPLYGSGAPLEGLGRRIRGFGSVRRLRGIMGILGTGRPGDERISGGVLNPGLQEIVASLSPGRSGSSRRS